MQKRLKEPNPPHLENCKLCWIGLNALVTVALDGATDSSDLADLLYIEFGKGFEYRTQLTIGMRDLGSRLSKQLVSYLEKAGEFKFSIFYIDFIFMLTNLNFVHLGVNKRLF